MALLALVGMSMLLMALFVLFMCLVAGSGGGHCAPRAGGPLGAPGCAVNKQYANTPRLGMSVHQVTSSTGCWPGVWVGPPPAVQIHPVAKAAPTLMQRRRPSGVAARVTSHGVLR